MGLKKFFKKNLRDIATVVGFVVGGPAGSAAMGAAIGQGVGSLAEGRSFKDSLMSAGKVYTAGQVAQGFGVTPETLTPGSGSFLKLGPGATGYGSTAGSYLEGIGGALRGTNLAEAGAALKALPLGSKLMLGAQGINLLDGFKTESGLPATMPTSTSSYLTQGLRPATLSNVYGTAPGVTSLASAMPGMPGMVDPITQTYLDMIRKQEEDYGTLAFPQFTQQPLLAAKDGGIARLADGGAMPKFNKGTPRGVEIDLTESGGATYDSNGSGKKDTIPALLADGEFVMTKQAVKGIGNGDHDKGIQALYAMMNFNENKAQNMGLGRA